MYHKAVNPDMHSIRVQFCMVKVVIVVTVCSKKCTGIKRRIKMVLKEVYLGFNYMYFSHVSYNICYF
jgi:hypothetical protein